MSDELLYEIEDGVAWATMNRPDARNALNAALRQALLNVFRRFNDDPAAQVLVLTGAGEKAFCSGGDLKEMADMQLRIPPSDYVPQPGRTIKVDKPIIAAVNGIAYGGGFLLAQSCDLCVASDKARFAITEAHWGRGAPWAAPLPWLVPPRVAMELLVTAEPISAQRAYEVGLINRVVPTGELRARTQELAIQIARNAPLSVRAGKAMVQAAPEHPLSLAYAQAEALFAPAYLSSDALEGPRAFQDKRPPVWRGE